MQATTISEFIKVAGEHGIDQFTDLKFRRDAEGRARADVKIHNHAAAYIWVTPEGLHKNIHHIAEALGLREKSPRIKDQPCPNCDTKSWVHVATHGHKQMYVCAKCCPDAI